MHATRRYPRDRTAPLHPSVPAPGRPLSLGLGLRGPGCNPWRPKHTRRVGVSGEGRTNGGGDRHARGNEAGGDTGRRGSRQGAATAASWRHLRSGSRRLRARAPLASVAGLPVSQTAYLFHSRGVVRATVPRPALACPTAATGKGCFCILRRGKLRLGPQPGSGETRTDP